MLRPIGVKLSLYKKGSLWQDQEVITPSDLGREPIKTIAQVASAIQSILGPISDQIGIKTGFTQRRSKVTGSVFMQTLVFSSLENAECRYSGLVSAAQNAGVKVTKQGLEQRFSRASAEITRGVLEYAVQTVIRTQPTVLPLLERFQGVYIRDSSTVSLPKALESLWPGCGSGQDSSAAVKLHTRLEVCSGQLGGPILAAGREHDSRSPFQSEALPKAALRMGDLGFFSLQQFKTDSENGVWWLSRHKVGTCLYDEQGSPIDLLTWLRQHTADQVDVSIQLGKFHRLPCRLLAIRVPPQVVEQRRRKMKEYARKKQTPLRAELLALAEWTLLLTNIPPHLLSIPEALVLLHVRWQIELLFKRWKSLFNIDAWRSANPWHILTELYAKLLSVVIQQWIVLTGITHMAHPSFWKAALVVRKFATSLALTLHDFFALLHVLSLISQHFQAYCRLGTRRSRPSLYQLLDNPQCISLA